MIPVSGSAYTYAYATLGELVAFLIGCALTLEFALGPGDGGRRVVGLRGELPARPRDRDPAVPASHPPGVLLVETAAGHFEPLASAAEHLVARGIDPASLRAATGLFNLPALVIVLAITAVVTLGIRRVDEPERGDGGHQGGGGGALRGRGPRLRAGGELASLHPREHGQSSAATASRGSCAAPRSCSSPTWASTPSPRPPRKRSTRKRDLPIGIMGSLGICGVLYILVACVLTGVVSYTKLNVPDPFAVGVDAIGVGWPHAARQDRRHLRLELGHPGGDAGPDPHLLRDGQGWPAPLVGGARPSPLQDAPPRDPRHRPPHGRRPRRSRRSRSSAELASMGTLFIFAVVWAGSWCSGGRGPT